MPTFIAQVQLVLAALSTMLPLLPETARGFVSATLHAVASALALAEEASVDFDELAAKLKALRADVEALAASGEHAEAGDIQAAYARVEAASAAFRAALAP